MNHKLYGVITGDITHSSLLSKSERRKLPAALTSYYSLLRKYFKDSLKTPIDLFSGDRWQILVYRPSKALHIALALKMLLKSGMKCKSIDSRISIAVGSIDFINKNKISKSDGEAFRVSGRQLDEMNGLLAISLKGQVQLQGVEIITGLIDFILSKITPKQALALFGALTGMNQSAIAQLWKPRVSQQSISLHLKNSGWHAVLKTLVYIENKLKHL
jgi:hypothetical protein